MRVFWILAMTVAAFGLSLVAPADSAFGYRRSKTCGTFSTPACRPGESPEPLYWPVRCVKFAINEEGSSRIGSPTSTIDPDVVRIVERAFETWNRPNCSDFTLVSDGLTDASQNQYLPERGWSGNQNIVVWRDDAWAHASDWLALTTTRYDTSGRISDADIEINTTHFDFSTAPPGTSGPPGTKDLQGVMTHEVGHFLGLDHSRNAAATMFEDYKGGAQNRELHQDDARGLCAIYPLEDGPTRCDDPEDFIPAEEQRQTEPKTCSHLGPRSAAPIWLTLLVGLGLLRWRRST